VLEATMGLLDGLDLGGVLRGALGEVEAAAMPTAINAVLAKTQYRDLNGLVAALQKGGLSAQVQSWLGPGVNLPITEDQLKTVLGNTQVQEFARHLGLPVDATLKLLAQYLPDIVDKASPNGALQSK
jgi:uncharacterized protein YidB (DUF937 family)